MAKYYVTYNNDGIMVASRNRFHTWHSMHTVVEADSAKAAINKVVRTHHYKRHIALGKRGLGDW